MGLSVQASLSFGVVYDEDEQDEDFELPWENEKYDGEIDDWWLDINGFVNPIESPYGENGYRPGLTEDGKEVRLYHQHRLDWLKQNPVPVEIVFHGYDFEKKIIAIKTFDIYLGDVMRINAETFQVDPGLILALKIFLKEADIKSKDDPSWFISCAYSR